MQSLNNEQMATVWPSLPLNSKKKAEKMLQHIWINSVMVDSRTVYEEAPPPLPQSLCLDRC